MDNNETTNPEDNTTDGAVPHGKLGQLLKDYREGANLDFDQAADKLCLTPSTLKALEAEDFDSLPEAPYVRGYLRGYSKLANVSSAEAIALYEQVRVGASPADFQYNFSPTNTVNDIIKPAVPPYMIKLGIALVGILLIAVLAMIPGVQEWTSGIWSEFSQKNVVAKQDTVPEENTTNQASTDMPASQTANTEAASAATAQSEKPDSNANKAETAASDSTNTDDVKKAEDVTETASADGTANNSVAETASKEESEKASDMSGVIKRDGTATEASTDSTTADSNTDTAEKASETQTADAASATTDDANKKPDAETTDASTQANAATMENTAEAGADAEKQADGSDLTTAATTANTEEDNKTEVEKATEAAAATTEVDLSNVDTASGEAVVKLVFKDEVWMRVNSGNKKVFSGLKKSGDAEEFKASKPLSFKVGNAPGVDIYINGKLYDQSPHVRGVVSKFKVQDTPQ